jgi:primosomal protein N' (replication factor Y) (superfamily II helicase)
MKYAEIAVNVAVNQTFHYHIPSQLAERLQAGHLVRVSFGTATQPGIVLAFHDESPVADTKPVVELLDPSPVVTQRDIELACWISKTYLAPIGQCLWLALPPGIVGKRDILVTLIDQTAKSDDPLQAKIIALLKKRGPLRGEQIQRSVKNNSWKNTVRAMTESDITKQVSMLTAPHLKPKIIKVAALAIHPDRINDTLRFLGKSTPLSRALRGIALLQDDTGKLSSVLDVLDISGIGNKTLDKLIASGAITIKDGTQVILPDDIEKTLFGLRNGQHDLNILRVLAREAKPMSVSWLYAQADAALPDLKRLEECGFVQLGETPTWRDPLAERDFVPMSAPRLTDGQRNIWQHIRQSINASQKPKQQRNPVFLLHGVTGSGKTELYLRSMEMVLSQGRQAIFLVPEIALTAQTVQRILARFPGRVEIVGEDNDGKEYPSGQVGLIHSKLKTGERYDTWRRARDGKIDIIVGTRSALFTPLPDVGVVILDEEHDQSYKQSPPFRSQVYYQARDVAERMMRENNGTLILGSATPDLETYFRAKRGDITYLHLPDRIVGHRIRISEQSKREGLQSRYSSESKQSDAMTIPLPDVSVVDMRSELKTGNTGIFSRELQSALDGVLSRGEQAILFMNRRGTSTYVFCRDCGYVVICPHCDMPLTYHAYNDALHCHHCNHQQNSPGKCPECSSNRIRFFGAGTQHIEAALQQFFPSANSLRWDADTASKPGDHDIILQRFTERQADVLIGTQMIAKGLDLPLVTLVGVISADVGLALPDFRAAERTFQLLTQVAGRAGRGLLGGKVVLQTYHPNHYAIAAASKHDYAEFYEREINYRREMGYPPFRRLVRIMFRHHDRHRVEDEARRAAILLQNKIEALGMTATEIIGPVPCFFERVNKIYRWQLLLRGPNPVEALKNMEFKREWSVDVDPVDVL